MWIVDGKVYHEAHEVDVQLVREIAEKTGVEFDDVARVIAAYLTATQNDDKRGGYTLPCDQW